ncbi:MAG: [LysW]-aminoadipate/[LysW]-glutamate kinase [Thaumarchaeota archaeon]|jgi:acetylglutamate/LysW-gamma-L-alpha-aminoadipate kinase|nr:[LysW]-aminoadipate/[LysW]-glutamate kinase [Nitrososphaerota archaeon]MBT3743571.1 [LysW]-aminoadipate/[LysW]-glutamate kinase [Nitrososphaerota archaeon]MBT4175434.1 [LysW]-aminoadipate/[LysW]-glutamate kinase [Nitrososphaerota archaeon]MBT4510309.1 [LysW]-aminoadipate/[LysW]-glutamate kinase [Nitrososphaerota archaeon]MBT4676075.1 [LysW]-aminoadipate/[LysW]-glutamate kinase [Nitrososphaerota archaeon]
MITIKIGGSVVDNLHPSTIDDIKKVVAQEGVILVHGGGKEVTKVTEQLGKEPKFVVSPSGIKSRYTDKETSEIFTMVMSGRINKAIVQMLQKNGINAIGLSGMDGKTIEANRKKKLMIMNEKGRKQVIDGGYTGKISNVNSDLIKTIMDKGYTPVISPIAISEESEFLNVDGDRAAANVAGHVNADKVLFITNVDGLLMEDKLVEKLSLKEAKEIMPKIGFGMEKKILAATEALEMGVTEALIANGQKENPISAAIEHNNCTVITK